MTDTAAVPGTHNGAQAAEHHDAHDAHGAHPTERQYWVVFVMLAVLTAVEVWLSYAGFPEAPTIGALVVLMLVKFMLVAGAFMHLYFDLKILNGRLFTWAFGGGLLLALGVYAIVFATFVS